MKKTAEQVRPSRGFAVKMKWRLFKKGFVRYFTGRGAKMHVAGATLVVFLVLSGGVGTYAYGSPDVNAEHPLYGFKRGIEAVEGGFMWGPEQKAGFHMKMAERRMDEMERLHKKFRENRDMMSRADAIELTIDQMESAMERSMMSVGEELDVEKAEMVLEKFEEKLGKMKQKMEKLPRMENGEPHIKKVREKIHEFREKAGERMSKLGPAREAIGEARKKQLKRVMLRDYFGGDR